MSIWVRRNNIQFKDIEFFHLILKVLDNGHLYSEINKTMIKIKLKEII